MNKDINQTKKILIIEDEQILGDILSHKLMAEGYQTFLVFDGEQGLEKIRELLPDLVLLDLVMPKKNGMEVLEELKKDDVLKKIPVVIISNSGQQSEIEKIVELGAIDYIIKAQFSPDEVLEKVKKYLHQEYTEKDIHNTKITPGSNNLKILLVEDDQFLSSIMAEQLEHEGYTTISATDGKQVFKIVEEHIPDLVLLDIIIPELNGIEVLKMLKSHEKYKDIPVIIFSNLGQDHERAEAKEAGADDFLVKVNFTPKEVVEKISALLRQKGKLE